MNILVKMFKVTLVVLLIEVLVTMAQDPDQCCRDNQLELQRIKWEIETLQDLFKDLPAKLKAECK